MTPKEHGFFYYGLAVAEGFLAGAVFARAQEAERKFLPAFTAGLWMAASLLHAHLGGEMMKRAEE